MVTLKIIQMNKSFWQLIVKGANVKKIIMFTTDVEFYKI